MLMKNVGVGGGRSPFRGRFFGLQLLAETAVAVSGCEEFHGGRCGHSDPASCFFAVKKRKPSFSQTHHSLLVRNPIKKSSPIKLVIKQKQPPAAKVSAFPPVALDVAPISFILPPPPTPPREAPIPRPPSSVAAYSPPPKVKRAAMVANSRREELQFPLSFRVRVSSAVGDGSVALGTKFSLVIRKTLTKTDLSTHHCRLAIPFKSMANGDAFLTSQEKAELEKTRGRVKLGVFLDPDFEIHSDVHLAKWSMETSVVYNVIGGWRSVLKKKEHKGLSLENGDEIELWSFRTVTGELCFALVTADSRMRADAAEKEAVGNADDVIESSRSSQRSGGGMMETESPMKGSSSGTSGSAVTHEDNHVQLIGGCSSSSPDVDLTLRL